MRNQQWACLAVVVIITSASCVRATEITGSHNSVGLFGYEALSGSDDVPADTGGVPSATFNDNGYDGLYAAGSGTSLTVEGGQFDANFNSGIETGAGATVTISGGAFNNNGEGVSADTSSVVTITGGQFLNIDYDLLTSGGTINLYGGAFGGTGYNFIAYGGGSLNVYGAFAGVGDGQTVTLPPSNSGSFCGELEDNSTAQAYTYVFGPITLHGTGTLPEPTVFGLLISVAAGLLARLRFIAELS